MLILSSVLLYWVLASTLAWEGHQFLVDKMHVLRGIVRDHPHERDALEEEAQTEVAAYQYTKYYIRVLDAAGGMLLETPGMAEVLPVAAFPAPSGAHEGPGDGRHWRSPDGNAY